MTRDTTLLLSGLHCASCVARIEQALGAVAGVSFASVNLSDETAFVQGSADPKELINAVIAIGYGAELLASEQEIAEKAEKQYRLTLTARKRQWSSALIGGSVLMALAMFAPPSLALAWFIAVVSLVIMLYAGFGFYKSAATSLITGIFTMDTLITLSTATAWLYSCYLLLHGVVQGLYFESSLMIIGFVRLGKYLELRAKHQSQQAITSLFELAPKTLTIISEQGEKIIPAAGVKVGDRIKITTGERVAVDGVVASGVLWADESMLTGEASWIEKNIGDTVRSGSLICDGAGVFIANKVGASSSLAQMIKAVRSAAATKPQIAKIVDAIAAKFVPSVIIIALIASLIHLALGKDFDFALNIFTTVLIIACPCALGLAVPLSSIAGIAKSAQMGILVKNMSAMQQASEIDTIVFDKTGTLTTGKMSISGIFGDETDKILTIAASLESNSSHPIANAITEHFNGDLMPLENIEVSKGKGISGIYAGSRFSVGNAQFFNRTDEELTQKFAIDFAQTMVFVAENDEIIGAITLTDTLRKESISLVSRAHHQGFAVIMMTGDRKQSGQFFAEKLDLDAVFTDLLPEDKAHKIKELQSKGSKVAMVGDGINDAIALSGAQVSIAMKDASDIATNAADFALMREGIDGVLAILLFSRKVMSNMKSSLIAAFMYNVIAIPIAAGVLYPITGHLLSPMIGALAMALSSISVVLNASRLLR